LRLDDEVWHVAAPWPPAWRAVLGLREPLFVRHVMPVDVSVPLSGAEADVATLAAAAQALSPRVDHAAPLSVQARLLGEVGYKAFAVNEAIARALGAPIDVKRPRQIVSLVVARAGPDLVGHLGLSTPAQSLSDWAGGKRRVASDPLAVSRAEAKLVEALEVFGLTPPPAGTAVDLGSAPGGWTRVLAARGLRVHAVDPAALDPRVLALPGVTWHATTAERWLASAPPSVDVLVADMKLDARDAARLVARLAGRVRAFAVVTLKLPSADHADQLAAARTAMGLFGAGWSLVGARQLFHNRSEVTVALAPGPPR